MDQELKVKENYRLIYSHLDVHLKQDHKGICSDPVPPGRPEHFLEDVIEEDDVHPFGSDGPLGGSVRVDAAQLARTDVTTPDLDLGAATLRVDPVAEEADAVRMMRELSSVSNLSTKG